MKNKSRAQEIDTAADLFSALGDRTRLQLVRKLSSDGPLSISQLTEGEEITRQAITKHLKIMEEAGLVNSDRQGRKVVYELEQKRLEIAKKYLMHISNRWDEALDRLRVMVED